MGKTSTSIDDKIEKLKERGYKIVLKNKENL